ncbi:MAG: NADH-quinone oxidoreductase subunit D [Acidobacteriota bacterium]|nr:NADH-quinone oxidoreductase subunit D [Acidobacteriota bacterium]
MSEPGDDLETASLGGPAPPAEPLLRTEPSRRVDRAEEMELDFGPRHPAIHGVLRLKLAVDGDRILDCVPVVGFVHRGIEKLFEVHTFVQNVAHTDRLDYIAAATGNLAYVGAVEKLLGLGVPPRARLLRTVLAELQRIASHLLWLATHAAEVGARAPALPCHRERERVLDLFEEYCGARLTLSSMRPGGLPYDLPAGWTERCRAFVLAFPGEVDRLEELLTEDRLWKKHTVGIGVLTPEVALEYGVTGPMLRGSGIDWDLRKALPYEAYGEVEFDVPLGRNGDVYDRYRVRMGELRQSCRIVLQCLDRLPEGPVLGVCPPLLRAAKGAEVYHGIEGPRGEIGFYLVGDGGPKPYRCHVRSPSLRNVQVLPELVRGQLIAELVAVIGSADIVLTEVDR